MTQTNIGEYIRDEIRREFDQRIFRGIAAEVLSDRMKLIRNGRGEPDDRYYAMADVYPIPEQGDEVVGVQVGDGAFILAKVVRPGTPVRHTELTDLNIVGRLTIGDGGSIEDADGSIWDQDGIRLAAIDTPTDAIRFVREGFDNEGFIRGAITTNYATLAMYAHSESGLGLGESGLFLRGDWNTPDDLVASLQTIDSGANGQWLRLGHKDIWVTNVGGGNVAFHVASDPNYQSMLGGMFIATASVVPTGNPTGGGFLFVDAGAGKFRGTSGTVTTFGPAEPHCPDCGRDFALEYSNERFGSLAICMWCFTEDRPRGVFRRDAGNPEHHDLPLGSI